MNTLEIINKRRSYSKLVEPAPTQEHLEIMLKAAVAAPDHKQLTPWRFFIISQENQHHLGDLLVKAALEKDPTLSKAQQEIEHNRPNRAPMIITVATLNISDSLPFEELIGATSAAIQNFLLAATHLGYGTIWRTGHFATSPIVKEGFGLASQDVINGFIYIGTIPPNHEISPKLPNLSTVQNWPINK